MVRINLIKPRFLSDQHLIAEYDEILMLIAYIKKYSKTNLDKIPNNYSLGKGHILFFKNKVLYLKNRHEKLKKEMNTEIPHLINLRNRLETGIKENISHVRLNGHPEKRLPGTLNLSFDAIEGESILLRLDLMGIAVSTGSACSSGSLDPSHVIMALGVEAEQAHGSIRFSIGRENTIDDIEYTIKTVKEVVETLRRISPIKLK